MRRILCAVAAALHLVGSLHAHSFKFKAGATFEGEVAEFKGTNVVVVVGAKDGRPYSLTVSTLSEADQKYLAGLRQEMQSRIMGAFGMLLGQKFSPALATSKQEPRGGGLPEYGFRPREPLPNFAEYWVAITPRSNQVFKIVAIGHFESQKALEERDRLLAALKEKYGKAVHHKMDFGSVGSAEYDTMTKDGRKVSIIHSFTGSGGAASISIAYEDEALRKHAQKESGGEERDGLKKHL